MLDQIVMSPRNGEVCIAIPLFRINGMDIVQGLSGYSVGLIPTKPLAYILDAPKLNTPQVISVEWAHKFLIFLGDL